MGYDINTFNVEEIDIILTRLISELNSKVVSQQCEAVLQLGELIPQHPTPSLVSRAVLRISELFQKRY